MHCAVDVARVAQAAPLDWQIHDHCDFFCSESDLIAICIYLLEGCVNLQQNQLT